MNETQPTTVIELDREMERIRSEQNLPMGIAAGAVAAFIGAGLWALVTVLTGWQIGWMAVGIGFLVGFTVCRFGKGIDPAYALAGAALSLIGCIGGNLFAVCGLVARQESLPFTHIVSQLTPGMAYAFLVETFNPMDLIFYGIAVYEGYKFSTRRIG